MHLRGLMTRQTRTARTSIAQADVIIKHDDLADRSRILKLKHRLLFDAQYHTILAAYTDLFEH